MVITILSDTKKDNLSDTVVILTPTKERIAMITLRKMRRDEYPAYYSYFIADYSREIVENYGHSEEVAIELAKSDLHSSFPNGSETNEHDLLCLDVSLDGVSKVVGYLWHSINAEASATFIYDFYIFEEYRGQGYGKQAIYALESQLKLLGLQEIKLRVAYQNKRALKLYQELGFSITGFNMSKKLSCGEQSTK